MGAKRTVFMEGSVSQIIRIGNVELLALKELTEMMNRSPSYVINSAISMLYNDIKGYDILCGFPVVARNIADNKKTFSIGRQKDREKITASIRYKVLERDNFTCVACGSSPKNKPGTILQVDHITNNLISNGDVFRDLQTLCKECNIGKH